MTIKAQEAQALTKAQKAQEVAQKPEVREKVTEQFAAYLKAINKPASEALTTDAQAKQKEALAQKQKGRRQE